MLRCREVAELVSDDVDGTLTWRQWFAVRVHLAMCGMCRRYARQMRATVAAIRSLAHRSEDARDGRAQAVEWWTRATGRARPDGTEGG
jgi:predicted anti-sigma-YlaC factor YlaD